MLGGLLRHPAARPLLLAAAGSVPAGTAPDRRVPPAFPRSSPALQPGPGALIGSLRYAEGVGGLLDRSPARPRPVATEEGHPMPEASFPSLRTIRGAVKGVNPWGLTVEVQ